MLKPIILTLFAFLGISTVSTAQSRLAHEVGLIFGPVTFQSDFGERNDLDTNLGNTGFGVGLVHFINFSTNSNRERFFSEHFKVRTELSFNSTKLNHFGKWTEKKPETLGVRQLKAMQGKSTVISLGSQLEFSPLKIHYYENSVGAFSPYVSLGFLVSYYTTEVSSSLGKLGSPEATFPKYQTPSDGRQFGFSSENGIVLSGTAGIGVHYKLNEMSDLMVEGRFQAFSSDWVDGLNPNKKIYKENKSNDAQIWFNIGYIQYL
ncbi:glutamate dehydrogenase [Flavobacterium tructae]|uniref:THC0290_0291 family protein n=1 Tax=Flavobacterium tructae TaxID=1114873 RepID=UPI0035A8B254